MKYVRSVCYVILLLILLTVGHSLIVRLIGQADKDSIYFQITSVDFSLFFRSLAGCGLITTILVSVLGNTLLFLFPSINPKTTYRITIALLKFALAISVVFSLVISLNEAHFTIVTSVVSFFALFSFLFPKKIGDSFKKLLSDYRKKDHN